MTSLYIFISLNFYVVKYKNLETEIRFSFTEENVTIHAIFREFYENVFLINLN